MANHLRRQLREAIATAVTGLVTTGARVYQSRVYPLQDAELPALRVYTRSEAATTETLTIPALMSRVVEVVIEAAAKANADLDDTLDQMAKEVETALGAGLTISGKFLPISYNGCDIEMSGDGEKPTGTISMRFSARLLYRANTPDAFA